MSRFCSAGKWGVQAISKKKRSQLEKWKKGAYMKAAISNGGGILPFTMTCTQGSRRLTGYYRRETKYSTRLLASRNESAVWSHRKSLKRGNIEACALRYGGGKLCEMARKWCGSSREAMAGGESIRRIGELVIVRMSWLKWRYYHR